MKATDEQIMAFIGGFIRKNGYSPSVREVGEAIGINSAGSVRYRLAQLRDKGLITYDDRKPRTIRVVG